MVPCVPYGQRGLSGDDAILPGCSRFSLLCDMSKKKDYLSLNHYRMKREYHGIPAVYKYMALNVSIVIGRRGLVILWCEGVEARGDSVSYPFMKKLLCAEATPLVEAIHTSR